MSASQVRKKEEMQTNYGRRMSQLQAEIDELRQQRSAGDNVDDMSSQSQSTEPTSPVPPPAPSSELRRYITRLERHEDRHLKVMSSRAFYPRTEVRHSPSLLSLPSH